MINEFNKEKKSLKERFFLILGLTFFLLYLVLGLMIIFWKSLPLQLDYNYRIAFGMLLIVYALIRFFRIVKDNKSL